MKITIDNYNGINVLRDDLLIGGTKSILMPYIIGDNSEYVYASPVYGGFQIALSAYCCSVGKTATIFCAKRNDLHPNTIKCIDYGANVVEVPYGYLAVVEKAAKDYCEKTGAIKLNFGANTKQNKDILKKRVVKVIDELGHEPKEIWCAIGSGTLVESILDATTKSNIYGVQVGMTYISNNDRLTVIEYPKPFDKPSQFKAQFPSTPNYDLKAYEMCVRMRQSDDVLFWNVM